MEYLEMEQKRIKCRCCDIHYNSNNIVTLILRGFEYNVCKICEICNEVELELGNDYICQVCELNVCENCVEQCDFCGDYYCKKCYINHNIIEGEFM